MQTAKENRAEFKGLSDERYVFALLYDIDFLFEAFGMPSSNEYFFLLISLPFPLLS